MHISCIKLCKIISCRDGHTHMYVCVCVCVCTRAHVQSLRSGPEAPFPGLCTLAFFLPCLKVRNPQGTCPPGAYVSLLEHSLGAWDLKIPHTHGSDPPSMSVWCGPYYPWLHPPKNKPHLQCTPADPGVNTQRLFVARIHRAGQSVHMHEASQCWRQK